MTLNPGDTLLNGQYRIIRVLGHGGFGCVYQAEDTLLREPVAIKEMLPGARADEAMLKRFLLEAKTTIRFRHPGIVTTYNAFSDAGRYYIVMEFMPGGSLEVRLAQGHLEMAEAVRVAEQVCDGLTAAHQQGVVHCDLKPANILFGADGSAKIADFGIAHVPQTLASRTWQTATGFTAGTPNYMSPEQLEGVRDDPRIDVYALGAMLYRMVAGSPHLDFETESTPAAQIRNMQRIQTQAPVAPSLRNPRVPRWLDDVVLRALATRADDRYASAAALRAALVVGPQTATAPQVAAPGGAPVPPPPAASRSVQPVARPRWFWPAVGASGLLLVALVVALALTLRPARPAAPTLPTSALPVQTTSTALAESSATPALSPAAIPTQTPRATLTEASGVWPTNTPSGPPTEAPLAAPTETPSATPTETPSSTPSPTPIPGQGVGKIAFVSERDGNPEIYIMRADGTSQQRLTHFSGDDWSPALSPDGQRVAFTSSRDAAVPGMHNIYAMSADGGGLVRLTQNQLWDEYAAWSPDGQRIAYVTTADGNAELFVMNSDGSGTQRVTHNSADDHSPSWSPDGTRLVFSSVRSGTWQIWTLDLASAAEVQLTSGTWNDSDPAWSPDGNSIAFTSDRDGNSEIYRMNSDGTVPTRLTSSSGRDERPSWSPDGQALAFWSERSGRKSDVYVMWADGRQPMRLTTNAASDGAPSWSR